MSRGLLDTSVLIAFDDEDLTPSLPEEASISAASLAELHFGILVARNEVIRQNRLRRLGVVESTFAPLPIDADVARAFGTVAHAVKAAGRQPRSRVMDLLIAATALVHGLPVYTRNPDDFTPVRHFIEVLSV